MNRIFTSNAFGLISILMLAWPMTAPADTASNFLIVNDDDADNSTVMELENDGFGDAGLCLQNGNLEFFVANSCAAATQEMTLDVNGNLGVGAVAPSLDVHIRRGNTPGVRLEQSTAGGSDGQIWDVAANDVNFFLRDASNGSNLPFRILAGAPHDSIRVDSAGDVGFGADNATAPLHVERDDDTFEMLYLEQSNTSANQDRNMMQLDNNGGIRFEFLNTELDTSWRFQAATGGADVFEIAKVGTGQIEMTVDASGNLDVAGTVNSSSSRTVKSDIEPVKGADTLAKLAELPIAEWRYTDDADGARHVGPMAEDFYAAFGLGADNKHIAPQDMAGVALAAVKALKQRSEQQEQTIEKQQARMDAQKQRIAELERQNRRLQAGLDELEALKAQVAALQAAQSSRQVASRQ